MLDETWIVIPAYNEGIRIEEVLKKTKQFAKNIIVVNDGSADNTAEIASKHTTHVLTHVINLGKGNALKTGCDYAVLQGAKSIVVMDADGQHLPEDIPRLLAKLENHDIVFSYRQIDKEMPFIYRFGNSALNILTYFASGIRLNDTQSGFRAMTRSAYEKVRWNSADYTTESEMIGNAGRHKLSYVEIPIKNIYDNKHKGTTVMDGLKIGFNMFLWRLGLK